MLIFKRDYYRKDICVCDLGSLISGGIIYEGLIVGSKFTVYLFHQNGFGSIIQTKKCIEYVIYRKTEESSGLFGALPHVTGCSWVVGNE